MKKNVLKSLVLGVGLSLLFSVGSYACDVSKGDEVIFADSNISNDISDVLEENAESLKEIKCRVVANLGEEFGEFSGYYKLDVENSFEGVKEITEGEAIYKLPENQIVMSFREGESGRDAFFTTQDFLLTPDKIYKNDDGKVVSLLDEKELYWEKIYEYGNDWIVINSSIGKFIEKETDTEYEVIAKFGEEFGEFSGYYKLDLANSFEGVKEMTGGKAKYGVGENCINISFGNGSCGGIMYLTAAEVSLTPDKVYRDSDNRIVSLENGDKLYWKRIYKDNEGYLSFDYNNSLEKIRLEEKELGNEFDEVIVKLGGEFGEFAGYYQLDLDKSFKGINKSVEGGISQYKLCDNQIAISYNGENGGGFIYLTTEDISLTPNKVYRDSDDIIVSLENGEKLYWNRVDEENGEIFIYKNEIR